MADEFEDEVETSPWSGPSPSASGNAGGRAAARLVARLFATADTSLKPRILSCLVRPLGPLGLAAIASGAFASLIGRIQPNAPVFGVEDSARYSAEQVYELARFVEQVQPEALQQVAAMLIDSPLGITAFSAAALTLLVRALSTGPRHRDRKG